MKLSIGMNLPAEVT